MKRLPVGLLMVLGLLWCTPADAQFIFSRKPRSNPSQRVPELILMVKTDPDERKRVHAAEELRDYDTATFTEIVPVLMDVLHNDKKVNVRLEALNSLARIRPLTPQTMPALEKAASADESWRVRWQARTTLTRLQVTNFSLKKADPASAQVKKKGSGEPPLLGETPIPGGLTIEVMPTPTPMPGPAIPKPLPPSVNPIPKQQGPALFP